MFYSKRESVWPGEREKYQEWEVVQTLMCGAGAGWGGFLPLLYLKPKDTEGINSTTSRPTLRMSRTQHKLLIIFCIVLFFFLDT